MSFIRADSESLFRIEQLLELILQKISNGSINKSDANTITKCATLLKSLYESDELTGKDFLEAR